MKQLKRQLDSVLKTLNTLTEKVKNVQSQLKSAEPVKVSKASQKRAKGKTAYDTVLEVINRSKKGVSTDQLKSKTRFNDKKIANIIYKGRKQGKIKSVQKGVYIKA